MEQEIIDEIRVPRNFLNSPSILNFLDMVPNKEPKKPHESLPPLKNPDINPLTDPYELNVPEDDPEILPDEDDPYEVSNYEEPPPGEGP